MVVLDIDPLHRDSSVLVAVAKADSLKNINTQHPVGQHHHGQGGLQKPAIPESHFKSIPDLDSTPNEGLLFVVVETMQ